MAVRCLRFLYQDRRPHRRATITPLKIPRVGDRFSQKGISPDRRRAPADALLCPPARRRCRFTRPRAAALLSHRLETLGTRKLQVHLRHDGMRAFRATMRCHALGPAVLARATASVAIADTAVEQARIMPTVQATCPVIRPILRMRPLSTRQRPTSLRRASPPGLAGRVRSLTPMKGRAGRAAGLVRSG